IEALEFLELGEGIGEAGRHQRAKPRVDRAEIAATARAFQRFEKMTDFNVSHALIRVMLKKFVPGFGMTEAAQDTQRCKVKIGDRLAVIAAFGLGINVIKGLEKESGNVSFELWISGHQNFLAGVSGIKHYLRGNGAWAAFGRIFELCVPPWQGGSLRAAG